MIEDSHRDLLLKYLFGGMEYLPWKTPIYLFDDIGSPGKSHVFDDRREFTREINICSMNGLSRKRVFAPGTDRSPSWKIVFVRNIYILPHAKCYVFDKQLIFEKKTSWWLLLK